MNAVHRLTGYDKRSERLERSHDIPAERLAEALALARVLPSDEHAYGSYPLDAEAIRKLSTTLNRPLNGELYDWFLEPFATDTCTEPPD